jgi:malate dehydrogenase
VINESSTILTCCACSNYIIQAYAGSKFASSILQAMSGVDNIVECSFVENNLTESPFFATKVSYL